MRSVPLMMNVPRSVIIGKSPMKTVCSLISPVVAFMKRAVTKSGRGEGHVLLAALVLGVLGRVEDVVGELQLQWPVKSSIGEMSRRTSATPSSMN